MHEMSRSSVYRVLAQGGQGRVPGSARSLLGNGELLCSIQGV